MKNNYSIPGTASFSPAGTLVASHTPNKNNIETSTTISSRATLPRLTRSRSKQLQEQYALATSDSKNNNNGHAIIPKKTITTPAESKKSNNYHNENHKNDDTPVVSPLPPNQAPPLRSLLSRNADSFSIGKAVLFFVSFFVLGFSLLFRLSCFVICVLCLCITNNNNP